MSLTVKEYWGREAAKLDAPSRTLEHFADLANKPETIVPYKKENDAN